MDMTPWDAIVNAYDSNWEWIAVVVVLLLLLLWMLSKMKRAPYDPNPEPLYPVPTRGPITRPLQLRTDDALEEWGKLAEQDQQRKEADEALQREVDAIVESAWKSEDRA
jgi:hypothetical protein